MALTPGSRIGTYEIVAPLGAGKNREMPYRFIDAETLIKDFLADVEQSRRSAS